MSKREPKIGFIFVTLLLDVLGLGLIIPVLPKLIQEFSGGDVQAASTTYGAFIALYALMQFVFAPILGSLSDRFGRRPVILVSLLGSGLDYLLLAFAPTLAWLFIGRIIAGITAANLTAITAYIADISTPEKRAQNFGVLGAAFGLGFVLGPALGGLLGDIGLRVPFLVVAVITLINWLYGLFVLPESLPLHNRREFSWARANPLGALRNLARYPIVLALAAVFVFLGLGQRMLESAWSVSTIYRFDWGTREIGLSLTAVGLAAGFVQGGAIRRIIPKLGERKAIIVGLIISVISLTLYGLAPFGWMFYVIPLIGAWGSIAGPSAQAIISKSVGADEQGEVQGGLAGINSLMGIVGPLIATNSFRYFISEQAPVRIPGMPFFLGAISTVVALLFAIRAFKLIPEQRKGGTPVPPTDSVTPSHP